MASRFHKVLLLAHEAGESQHAITTVSYVNRSITSPRAWINILRSYPHWEKYMKFVISLAICGVVGLAAAVILRDGAPPDVTITLTQDGLTSLKAGSIEYLQSGEFTTEEVLLRNGQGATRAGSTTGTAASDPQHREIKITYPWGTVKTAYKTDKNR